MKTKVSFNRGARLTLIFALLLITLSLAQIIYRATLPTDGWSVYTTEAVESELVYYTNLVGALSDMEREDVLLAVGGRSTQGTAVEQYHKAPPGWHAGGGVTMTVRRGDEQLSIAVPVVNWAARAVWRHNTEDLSQASFIAGALILLAVGWFTFLRRPDVPSAHALLLLCTAFGATVISGLLPDGLSVRYDRIAYWTTAFFSYAIFGTLLAPSLLAFTWLFPRPKRAVQHRPWLALLPYGLGLAVLILLLSGASGAIGWFATLGMMITSILSLVHSAITQRDTVSRAQMRWAVGGFVVGLGLFMLTFPVALNWVSGTLVINLLNVVASLGFPVVGVGLAVAVLRYRLFDIDVIIRKTLVYALLTALLALVYFGSVVLMQRLFTAIAGQQSPVAIVISTLLIAALFNPLRRRVHEGVDRRFFRSKYDAANTLAAFAAAARDEVDLEQLTDVLLGAVQDTMQPAHVSLWLKEDPQSAPLSLSLRGALQKTAGPLAGD